MPVKKLTDKDREDIKQKFIYRYVALKQRPNDIKDILSREYNIAPRSIERVVTVTDAKRAAATAFTNQTAKA